VKTPDNPVGPAFDKAADAMAAWRKRQEAALTEAQKQEFRRLELQHNKALREFSTDFYDHESERIDAAKRRVLLEKPDLALRMLPTQRMREARAAQLASVMVHRQHDEERKTMEQSHRQIQDRFLYDADLQRAEATREKPAEKDRTQDLAQAFKDRAAKKDLQRGDEGRDRER
jgi:hypothetical protein